MSRRMDSEGVTIIPSQALLTSSSVTHVKEPALQSSNSIIQPTTPVQHLSLRDKENHNHQNKPFFTPDCCWVCRSPSSGPCPYHPVSRRNHPHNSSSGSHRISRVTNESFRAAVDKSYDDINDSDGVNFAPDAQSDLNQFHSLQPTSTYATMRYNGHQSASDAIMMQNQYSNHQQQPQQRPSAAALSMGSQTTNATLTTITTGTSTDDSDMRPLFKAASGKSNHRNHHATSASSAMTPVSGLEDSTESNASSKGGKAAKKPGIFRKILKFGSKRSSSKNKQPPTVQELMEELESDAEKIRAKRSAQIENERIQEHYRRLKSEQQQRVATSVSQQRLQPPQGSQLMPQQIIVTGPNGISSQMIDNQIILSDDGQQQHLIDDSQYGLYMNLQQIQAMKQKHHQRQVSQVILTSNQRQQLQQMHHPVTNRPMIGLPASSSNGLNNPSPVPTGGPFLSASGNSAPIVAFSNRPIPMRKVPAPPPVPSRPPAAAYGTIGQMNPAAVMNQRVRVQPQQMQQQQQQQRQHVVTGSGLYGMIGPSPHPDSMQNQQQQQQQMMFKRQLSNHRIVPVAGGPMVSSGGYLSAGPQQQPTSHLNGRNNQVYLYSSLPPTVNQQQIQQNHHLINSQHHQIQQQQQPIYGQYYGTIGSHLGSSSNQHQRQMMMSMNPQLNQQQQAIYHYSTINGSDV